MHWIKYIKGKLKGFKTQIKYFSHFPDVDKWMSSILDAVPAGPTAAHVPSWLRQH